MRLASVIGSRVASSILVAAVAYAGASTTLAAQTTAPPLAGLGGLGDLIGSFFSKLSFVGAAPVSLARLRDRRSRIQLHGFSIVPPAGSGWYLAYSPHTSANTLQTAWFVRDPHLFSEWAKGDRIRARPSSLIAKLEFYGTGKGQYFAARVKEAKTSEWSGDLSQVLALDVRAITLGALSCAEYEGRLMDRGAPPGFVEHPFVVTVSGRACPHPDADGFVVDVSLLQRTREGEPMPDRDPAGDAFIQSLHIDAFDGPIVQDILLMDRASRPRPRDGGGFWIENTALNADSLWVGEHDGSIRPALKRLTRVDPASNQLIARRPVDGNLAGTSGRSVWLFAPGGITRPDGTIEATATWRLDESATDAVSLPVSCAPGEPFWRAALQVGAFGTWLGCQTPVLDPRKPASWRAQRRLDPTTGALVADFAIAPGPVHGDSHLVWAEEHNVSISTSQPCRVHAIDPATNQLVRTLVLGSSGCRHLTIVGNDAWLVRADDAVTKIDLTTGRTVYSVKPPKGRWTLGLAVADDAVWLATTPSGNDAGLKLGSEGGLMRFDRTTGAIVGLMLPTGTADRMIGVRDHHVWLYDSAGAIVRVRIK